MIEARLSHQLNKVAARFRKLRFWRSLAVAWLSVAIGGAVLLWLNRSAGWYFEHAIAVGFGIALAAAAACALVARRSARSLRWVAQQIEAAYPELNCCLLAAVEQRPELPGGRFGYLQESVIRQALRDAYPDPWVRVAPARRIGRAVVANIGTLLLLLMVAVAWQRFAIPHTASAASSLGSRATFASGRLSLSIEPGNTEVERGTSLLVLARFQGPQPSDVTLVYRSNDGEITRLAMTKSLDDPVFGGRIASVDAPLDYHVELPDYASETYHVTVFEYPKLVRADAKLVYPAFTSLGERLVQDVRTVSAVEGSELTLLCHLNKPVASASLVEKGAEPLVLSAANSQQPGANEPNPQQPVYQVTFPCLRSRRLALELVDHEGRRNQKPVELVIRVLPNKPADLKLVFPARDIDVSPLEEVEVRATAWDDYGVKRFGLTYSMAGGEEVDVVLGQGAAGRERHEMAHVIRCEELDAQPDQLLSYYFWAEDSGPDGEVRRTQSDMYFAEVRPFEEIFRQGQPPPGGQSQQQQQGGSQNAQAAQELAQLEKEIINATWKLIRRETPGMPSESLAGDAQLVYESQGSALEQATALAEKLQDLESRRHAAAVTESMSKALKELQAAKDGPAVEPLKPALAAEQAAYQALLKLRAREHRVVRGQQRGGQAGGGGNRANQQLQQLELSNDENRYETQRTAKSEQSPQDRENRQVLSRLSELARRQNDLNERLKELQSALEEARSEQEREEIRRQLKRLREEEQEILRDTDELASRMESPENQERMADARQQLDQTRDQVRRASEALEEELVSQAAAAGTRAQRDFQELKDEFRRRASGQFDEEMRQMRNDARQLDEKEQDLGRRLADNEQPGDEPRSLRDRGDREKIPDELVQQKQRLEELLERMRSTVQEAEQAEPLLSEQLYDTVRDIQERNPGRALDAAEASTRRGLLDDARQQEQIARGGISELREGIERAAESVLGDETEALRRARDELKRLGDELNEEIARNSPRTAQRGGDEPNDSTGRAQRRPGEQADGERPAPSGDEPSGDGEQPPNDLPGERPANDGRAQQSSRPQAGQPQPGQQNQPGEQGNPQADRPGETAERGGENQRGGRGGLPTQARRGNRGARNLSDPAGPGSPGGFEPLGEGAERVPAPIAGEDFLDWSDRLRDVEEMVGDDQLQAEAARIRDRARGIRVELKRHSRPPNWDLVYDQVLVPLVELRRRVAEELLRRASKDALLPLDRDPVPPKYQEKTRRYYERLGTGR